MALRHVILAVAGAAAFFCSVLTQARVTAAAIPAS